MRLYFARHGESEANLTRTFSNRDLWHPLTAQGEATARDLAESLAGEGITALHCSPVLRARQTAGILGERLGLTPVVVDGLREFDVGRWEGTDAEEGWAEHRAVTAAWFGGDLARRVSNGESLEEVIARLSQWAQTVALNSGNDDRVLAISHGGTLHGALPHLLAGCYPRMAQAHPLGYCDVVVAEARDVGPYCLRWGPLELSG